MAIITVIMTVIIIQIINNNIIVIMAIIYNNNGICALIAIIVKRYNKSKIYICSYVCIHVIIIYTYYDIASQITKRISPLDK